MPNLILSARQMTPALVYPLLAHTRTSLSPATHVTIALKASGLDCGLNDDTVRPIASWSEPEALAAACAGWTDDVAIWWPCSDDPVSWPNWQLCERLTSGLDAVFNLTGQHVPVGFRGVMIGETGLEAVKSMPRQYIGCDLVMGPVAFRRTMAGALITQQAKMASIPDAGIQLCLCASLAYRRCCYLVTEGIEPGAYAYTEQRRPEFQRIKTAMDKAKWRSRVGAE